MVAGFMTAKAGLSVFDTAMRGLNWIKSFNPFSAFKNKATEGLEGATNSVKRSKSTIAQLLDGMGNVIKSAGNGIANAAKGIGTGIKVH